jgi:beta-aspartyl-dipeptidase (metallo-type)
MILIRNCELYAPTYKGMMDVLIGGSKILAVGKNLNPAASWEITELDASGLLMIPGLIDGHVHIAGAGGEGGPSSRTPELPLQRFLEAGVTTAIGCLGTDGITRNVESVLMKVKGLRQQGISSWMYTGSYQIPPPTILGDVTKDLAMIEEVIGVGEIALSDHRSSFPTTTELIKLVSQARVGAMLGKKSGIINIHMGDAKDPFKPLYDVATEGRFPLKQFLPTHCNRNAWIFEDAKSYGKQGYVDITASAYPYFPDDEIKPSKAVAELLKAGVPLGHITLTSDGGGSLPLFDTDGNLLKIEIGYPKSILTEIADAVKTDELSIEQAVSLATINISNVLKLESKGRIEKGMDADLVLLSKDFDLVHVIAMGELMVRYGELM